eukprot:PhM_4_TR16800/c1_g2_i2/m.51838
MNEITCSVLRVRWEGVVDPGLVFVKHYKHPMVTVNQDRGENNGSFRQNPLDVSRTILAEEFAQRLRIDDCNVSSKCVDSCSQDDVRAQSGIGQSRSRKPFEPSASGAGGAPAPCTGAISYA